MNEEYIPIISYEKFKAVQPLLESTRKRTKPRTVDIYEVFCAILYILDGGYSFRMLPSHFPKWRTVHEYFKIWSIKQNNQEKTILNKALEIIDWRGPRLTRMQQKDKPRHYITKRKFPMKYRKYGKTYWCTH